MSQVVKTKFILTGPLAGQSIVLGSLSQPYEFVDGELELISTIEDRDAIGHFLKNSYQVYREGHIPEGAIYGVQANAGQKSDKSEDEVVPSNDSTESADVLATIGSGYVEPDSGATGVLSQGGGQPDFLEPKPKKVK